MILRVHTGDHRTHGGAGQGLDGPGIVETDAVVEEGIDGRGGRSFVAIARQPIGAQSIDGDDHDRRRLLGRRGHGNKEHDGRDGEPTPGRIGVQ